MHAYTVFSLHCILFGVWWRVKLHAWMSQSHHAIKKYWKTESSVVSFSRSLPTACEISVRLFIARFAVHCDTRACLPPSGTFDMTLVVVTVVWLLINAGLTAVTKASLVQNQEFWIFQVRILHDT